MIDEADIIVDLFRRAAWGMSDWTEGLDRIVRISGGHVGQLGAVDRRGALAVNLVTGVGPDAINAYFAANGHDPAVNPRTRALIEGAPFHCITDEDFLSLKDRTTLPIFRDLFSRFDVPYGMQVRLGTLSDLVAGVVVMRSRSQGPAEREAVGLLAAAAPGIADAVHAGLKLGTMHDASLVATAETLAGPAILLGRDLRIVSLSAAAETIVRAGACLTIRAGRLCALDHRSGVALAAAHRAVTVPAAAARRLHVVALLSANGGEPLLADICPLPTRTAGPLSQADALLTIRARRHSEGADGAQLLSQVFNFTPAEAQVAMRLAEGDGLAQIAAGRNCTIGTVRTQLKALFDKTETHRQSDLIVKLRAYR